jgi:O-antigen ligase
VYAAFIRTHRQLRLQSEKPVSSPHLPHTLVTRRDHILFVLVAAAVPIILFPAYVDLRLAIALVLVPVVVLAARSIVYPVALGGVGSLGIALLGSNPLPNKALFTFLTGWLVLGLVLAVLRGEAAGIDGRLVRVAVGATAVLAVLLVARLQPGAYPSVKVQLFLAQNVLLLFAGILIARKAEQLDLYLILALCMAMASAVVLVRQFLNGSAADLYAGRFTTSVDDNPILAGREAANGVVIAMYFVLTARTGRLRVVALAAFPLLAVTLLASGSRGPMLALAVALLVMVSLSLADARLRARLLTVAVGATVAVAIAPLLVPGDAIARSTSFLIGSHEGLSSNGRFELWQQALDAFLAHPLVGLGTGGFAVLDPIFQYPHNIGLESAAELGIVGLAAVAVLLVATATRLGALWDEGVGLAKAQTALVAGLFAAACVNSLLSDAIEGTAHLWLAVGLAAGLDARARDDRPVSG